MSPFGGRCKPKIHFIFKTKPFISNFQIARQNIRAVQLETEVSKYSQLTKSLWIKVDVSQKELEDVRKQFQRFQVKIVSLFVQVSCLTLLQSNLC